MLCVTRAPRVGANIRPKDEPSIGIIYQPWPTKTPIMMTLRLIGFKLLSKDFSLHVTVILTFDLLTPKIIGSSIGYD